LSEPASSPAPADFASGRLSPVSHDSSTLDWPSITTPSTGTRSPGRSTNTSPSRTSKAVTSRTAPPRSTRARSGRNDSSAASAEPVRRFAPRLEPLAEQHRVMIAVEVSKYVWSGMPSDLRGPGRDRDERADEERGGRTERDQRVHVGAPVPERRPRAAVEARPGDQLHGQRERELQPVGAGHARRAASRAGRAP
jgi:hypothetical protein